MRGAAGIGPTGTIGRAGSSCSAWSDGLGGPAPAAAPARAVDRGWRRDARRAAGCTLAFWAAATLLDLAAGTLTLARAALWAALAAGLLAVLLPPRLSAGPGWLAARGLLREHRVRTDALVGVSRYGRGAAPMLVLRDADGHRLLLDPRVLAADPLLWHELDTGARASRRNGTLRAGDAVLRDLAARIDDPLARAIFTASGLH